MLCFCFSSSCVPYVASFFVLCTLCCQFLRLVYPMLPVSSSCVALWCQFLWMVYFWLPLWYSLTFIYTQIRQRQNYQILGAFQAKGWHKFIYKCRNNETTVLRKANIFYHIPWIIFVNVYSENVSVIIISYGSII